MNSQLQLQSTRSYKCLLSLQIVEPTILCLGFYNYLFLSPLSSYALVCAKPGFVPQCHREEGQNKNRTD